MRVSGQSYLRSLDDFIFMLRSDTQRFSSQSTPPFDQADYRELIDRVGPKTHRWVRNTILWQLKRWGDTAAPALIDDLYTVPERKQLVLVARALAQIQHVEGIREVALVLENMDQDDRDVPMLRSRLLKAIGVSKVSDAAEILIRYYDPDLRERTSILEALGRLGAADFLIEEFEQEADWERKDDIIWPLAYSRKPEAMRLVVGLMLHPDYDIRVRARSALDQAAPGRAVDAALDLLATTDDEYVYSSVMQTLFATRHAADNSRVVPFLAQYIDHPVLAWEANYALGRIGSREAQDVLIKRIEALPVSQALGSLDELYADAVPLLAGYLKHDDPSIRLQTIWKLRDLLLPQTGPLVEPLTRDPDRWVQQAARESLLTTDKIILLRSFVDHLPENVQSSVWYGFRFEMDWGFRKGFQWGLDIFSWVHIVGTGLSLILGLLLLFNRLRIFEPFRFNLFIQFLLVEGFVGDFFFMDQGTDNPWQLYQLCTAIHLLLLIGFLCKERDRVPGELRNRFERFGGASIWLIAPLLLFFGTPVLAVTLRQGFHDIMNLLPFVALLGVTACLVVEQWALPWRLMPRAARLERIISGLLSSVLLAIIAKPVLSYARQQQSIGQSDNALFSILMLLPLLWLLVMHLYHVGIFRRGTYFKLPKTPSTSLAVIQDGERISLRLRTKRKRAKSLFQLFWICCAGLGAAALAGRSGNAPGMVLALLVAPVGAAVAALTLEALRPHAMIQIRHGYLRVATCILGGAMVGGAWSRHAAAKLLRDGFDMDQQKLLWLAELQQISTGQGMPMDTELPNLAMHGTVYWRNENNPAAGLDLELTMTNLGKRAISPADYDRHAGMLAWHAQISGQRGDVCFRRRDRENSFGPGIARTINVRIFPDDDSSLIKEGFLTLTCLGGGQMRLQLPDLLDPSEERRDV